MSRTNEGYEFSNEGKRGANERMNREKEGI
jgi:hypothetical protein